jgi:O-antigen/teichoic acid export membrane protein
MIKQVGIYALAVLADRGLSMILVPVLTRVLTPAEYGVMDLLDLTTSLIITLAGVRLGQAIAFFFTNSTDEGNRLKYVTTALLGALAIGAAISCLIMITASFLSDLVFHSPGYTSYFRLLGVSLGLSIPMEAGLAYIRVLGKAAVHARICVFRSVLTVSCMFLFVVHLRAGVAGWLWSAILSSLPATLLVFWYALRGVPYSFNFAAFRQMVEYSLPMNVTAVGMLAIHFGDRWFLRDHISLARLGIYGLAYKIGMLIAYLQAPFSTFWASQMYALAEQPNHEQLYAKIGTYTTLCYSIAAVVISSLIYPLSALALGPAFRGAAEFVPFIAIAYVIRAVGEFVRCAFYLKKRTSLDAAVTLLGSTICLAGYYYLIPWLKEWGAILATALSFGSMLVISFWQGQRIKRYPYEWKRLILIGAYAFAFSVFPVAVGPRSFAVDVLVGVGSLCGFLSALLVSGFLRSDEKVALRELVTTIRFAYSQ